MFRKNLAIAALTLLGFANSHFCTATKIFTLNSNRRFGQVQIVYFETSILHNVSHEGTNKLFWAIAENNLDGVKLLCPTVENIDTISINGINPLQLACRNDCLEIVKYLVEVCKADVNYQSEQANTTPLCWACSGGNKTIVKYLLDHKTDPSKGDKKTKPIHEVILSDNDNYITCLQFLVQTKKIDINAQGNRDRTPLHVACFKGHVEVIKYLLKNGANQNIRSEFNETAWDEANGYYHQEKKLLMLTLLNLYKAPHLRTPYFCKNLAQCAVSGKNLLQAKPHKVFYDMKIKFTNKS